jgi:hypothetical protein
MASRHHYMQDDKIHRMLKELDHHCDSIEDESVFIDTLPSPYILQSTGCIHGTNRNVTTDIWFS